MNVNAILFTTNVNGAHACQKSPRFVGVFSPDTSRQRSSLRKSGEGRNSVTRYRYRLQNITKACSRRWLRLGVVVVAAVQRHAPLHLSAPLQSTARMQRRRRRRRFHSSGRAGPLQPSSFLRTPICLLRLVSGRLAYLSCSTRSGKRISRAVL